MGINCIRTGANDTSDLNHFKVDNLVNLKKLNLQSTKIKSISDLSKLTKLEELNVGGSKITTLNLASNSKLKTLNAYHLDLTSITLPSTCIITSINLGQDYEADETSSTLKSLDVSKCTSLQRLYINGLMG